MAQSMASPESGFVGACRRARWTFGEESGRSFRNGLSTGVNGTVT